MESSVGCHSMEVIGAECQLNEATGVGVEFDLKYKTIAYQAISVAQEEIPDNSQYSEHASTR